MKNPHYISLSAKIQRSIALSISRGLLLGLLACAGCATPNCDVCSNLCCPTPDCYGYYPTCWSPWPCPDGRCPNYWDGGGIPVESIPDPGIPYDMPPEEVPAESVDPHAMPLSTFVYPAITVEDSESVRLLPRVGNSERVAQSTWPSDHQESEFVLPAHTPFPSGALNAAEYEYYVE